MAYPRVPKLRVPFQIVGKSALAVEQNSDDEVFQCVEAVIRTPEGSRIDEPEFGIPDYAFQGRIDGAQIQESIDEWEPRALTALGIDPIIDLAVKVLVGVLTSESQHGV
jgi:phage baseplate assembly protein W